GARARGGWVAAAARGTRRRHPGPRPEATPRRISPRRAQVAVAPLARPAGAPVSILIDEAPEVAVLGGGAAHLHRRVRVAGELEAGDRRLRLAWRGLGAVAGGVAALAL